MKILFVCQQYIHSARWINQLKDSHHEIYVFDCLDRPVHEELKWTNFIGNWSKRKLPYIKGEDRFRKKKPALYEKIESILKVTASNKLVEVIQEIKPDLVHSLEMQSQTYHLLKARKKNNFKWAYSSWGSDLYLYQNDAQHSSKIKNVLFEVDYFFSDNTRDISLAKNLDFKGVQIPVYPGGGGYKLEEYKKYILPVKERNTILIKGYHHWVGRALHILEALELKVDEINKYDIYVYSAHQVVINKIEYLNKKYALNIEYSSRKSEISHEDLLKKFGSAKIAIGNSVSDGIPNTLLEAIICGAFPIQSNPGRVTEDYIENQKNGLLIDDVENVQEIADKISFALHNDGILKLAFEINQEIAKKLEYKVIQEQVLESYSKIESSL